MDGWLKLLISAACVVVIAGGGFYLWDQYQIRSEDSERRARNGAARAELFQLAGANEGEDQKVRRFCETVRDRLKTDLKDNDLAPGIARNCRAFGF
ncbi:hypothetical protein [Agrobacterium pusense]|uniref:hypothetical protein n=1 Tax=Agrobacterium pusense TaxID=648995 RepID=UPI0010AE0923|nr:hypothetical protein [Agrobacterium pusense]WCK26661.1 hypothetical protein CFBP5496_0020895 [Agrobacterium pusense]